MRGLLSFLCSLASLTFLLPSRAVACQGNPPRFTAATTILGISPQVAIVGMTYVYVNGWCFGDSQGSGTVTVNGETIPANDIISWSDAEIIFTLPYDASSGDLKVTSSSYGSDDSLNESQYANRGNDAINASFTVVTPSLPPLCCIPGTSPPMPFVSGAPAAPKYVTGTWDYNERCCIPPETFTFNQVSQNPDGTWSVTGTDVQQSGGPCGAGTWPLNATLDQYGDLFVTLPCAGVGPSRLWRILGSGDVTSQGYGGGGCTELLQSQWPSFFQLMSTDAEGQYFYCELSPLFRAGTNFPEAETPAPMVPGWGVPLYSGSAYPTYGEWQRSFPILGGGFIEFAGRSVYEQSGAGATDTCYAPGSPTPKVTGVSGGGWFVDSSGSWAVDSIGMKSQGVDWYLINVPTPCQFTMVQQMLIDGRTVQTEYTSNQLTFQIQLTKIYSEVQPQIGPLVEECENYPSLKGKCRP